MFASCLGVVNRLRFYSESLLRILFHFRPSALGFIVACCLSPNFYLP
jgi:hypothetical protein